MTFALQKSRQALRSDWLTRRTSRLAIGALAIVIGASIASAASLWPYVISGISDGSIYSLAAVGLVLTYKTSGVFNFAIGGQAAASAYVFYTLWVTDRIPWPVAATLTVLGVGLLGSLLFERLAYYLGEASAVYKVVAVIGLLVLLQSALTASYGQVGLEINQFLPTHKFHVAGVNVLGSQIIVSALAVASTVALYYFFKRSRPGAAMQALVDDPTLLSLQGTSPIVVRRYAWAIGSCFVSVSGILVAPELGIDVNEMLLLFIAAFGAASLGSFTSLPITFVSALAIGVASNVMSYAFNGSHNHVLLQLYEQVPFIALVGALLLLPKKNLTERGSRRVRIVSPVASFPLPVVLPTAGVALAVCVALPYLVGQSNLNQYSTALGFAVVLGSLGLLLWYSGQISLCQMAFAAVGATTLTHAENAGIPWIAALVLAGLIAVPVGALVALPSFRLSGIYLAMATFAIGLLFQNLIYVTFLMFGDSDSLLLKRPVLGALHTSTDEGYYYVTLVISVLCALAIVSIRRTRMGRLLRGLADSPAALNAHAADTRITSLLVFCISAFLAAIGGALIAGVTMSASGSTTGPYSYFNSLVLVAILAFCRRQPLLSPAIAAVVFEVIKIYRPFNTPGFIKYEGVIFGLLAMAVAVAPGLRFKRVPSKTQARQVKRRVTVRASASVGA